MPPVGLVTTMVFVRMSAALSSGELVLLKVWSSPEALNRFSRNPLVEEEWVSKAPLSKRTLRKAWLPSTVSVQLVTAMSRPSKLVLLMPMTASLVNVAACARNVPSARTVMGARRCRAGYEVLISERLGKKQTASVQQEFLGFTSSAYVISLRARTVHLRAHTVPSPAQTDAREVIWPN